MRKLFSQTERVERARAALAEYFGRFTLDPTKHAEENSYTVRGEVDFFDGGSLVRTGGAGGQNRTGYARLFRAALYH